MFWASLYHLMFKYNGDSMNDHRLGTSVKKASKLFSVNIDYYAADKDSGKVSNWFSKGAAKG